MVRCGHREDKHDQIAAHQTLPYFHAGSWPRQELWGEETIEDLGNLKGSLDLKTDSRGSADERLTYRYCRLLKKLKRLTWQSRQHQRWLPSTWQPLKVSWITEVTRAHQGSMEHGDLGCQRLVRQYKSFVCLFKAWLRLVRFHVWFQFSAPEILLSLSIQIEDLMGGFAAFQSYERQQLSIKLRSLHSKNLTAEELAWAFNLCKQNMQAGLSNMDRMTLLSSILHLFQGGSLSNCQSLVYHESSFPSSLLREISKRIQLYCRSFMRRPGDGMTGESRRNWEMRMRDSSLHKKDSVRRSQPSKG